MKKKRMLRGVPDPVDIHVGSRLRRRRKLMGLNQEKLGDAVGLPFQQLQKYENGANRIGTSPLFQFSHILKVPISFFFKDMPSGVQSPEDQVTLGLRDREQESQESDIMARRETLELVRAYYWITDPRIRRRIFELAKSLSGPSSEGY